MIITDEMKDNSRKSLLRQRKLRAILDTNVWSRLAESPRRDELRSRAEAAEVSIVVAPSVVFELLRIPIAAKRDQAIELVTRPQWSRLMPEAYLESEEIVDALRRRRGAWVVKRPDLARYNTYARLWQPRNLEPKRPGSRYKAPGFWQNVRNTPDWASETLSKDGGFLEAAHRQAIAARREMLDQGAKEGGSLRSVFGQFKVAPPGVTNKPFAMWRGDTLVSLSYALFDWPDDTYRDWIGPFIDLDLASRERASWSNFWLYEVEPDEVPRQWLRWAISFQQRFRRVSHGAPCDTQLSAYLPDAHVLFTADGPFAEFTNRCASDAPVPIARAVKLPAADQTVPTLFESISSLGRKNDRNTGL